MMTNKPHLSTFGHNNHFEYKTQTLCICTTKVIKNSRTQQKAIKHINCS